MFNEFNSLNQTNGDVHSIDTNSTLQCVCVCACVNVEQINLFKHKFIKRVY